MSLSLESKSISERAFQLYFIIILLGCLVLATVLSVYMYVGTFMRFSGDDYCYGKALTEHGFVKAQVIAYSNPMPFHGNRYSLTLFSTFASIFDPAFNGLLPGTAIFLWVAGMIFLISTITKVVKEQFQLLEAALLAGFLVFISLYTAPDLPESIYWRSGMLPYTAPIIGSIFLLALILHYALRKTTPIWVLCLIFLMAILVGGFSEAAAMVQATYLAALLLLALYFKRKGFDWGTRIIWPIMLAFGGTIISMFLLTISPATRLELLRDRSDAAPFGFLTMSAKHAYDFMITSLKGLPLPHTILFAFSFSIAFLNSHRRQNSAPMKSLNFLTIMLAIVALCFVVVFSSMVPSAFARAVYPNPRALILPRFAMLLSVFSMGWISGYQMRFHLQEASKKSALFFLFACLFLIAVWLYPARAIAAAYSYADQYQPWAIQWDQRDQQKREAKQQGQIEIEVIRIDKIIQWVGELSPDSGYWYNRCAAGYYGVNTIKATLPE